MKSVSILMILLGIKLSKASPHPMITASPKIGLENRQVLGTTSWTAPELCNSYAILLALSTLDNLPATMTIDKYEVCSQVLQPTTYVYSTTTLVGSTTRTKTISTTTATTTTDPLSRTATVLCPTPSPSMLCGPAASFTNEFLKGHLISHEVGYENANACKQACLADSRCKSFVTYDSSSGGGSCGMYSLPLAEGIEHIGGATNEGHWFDRACSELLPAGCTSPGGLSKRGRENLPIDLAKNLVLGFACSCVITSASPLSTILMTRTEDLISKTTTDITEVKTQVSTSLLHLVTSYSTVA